MGRHHKYKQIQVLEALDSLPTLTERAACKRFGISRSVLQYAKRNRDDILKNENVDEILKLPNSKKEIEKLTKLIHISLEALKTKLHRAKPKDLAIIASILFDKRNLLSLRSNPDTKNFPEISKKTKVLIEQYEFSKNKNSSGNISNINNTRKQVIDSS